MTVNHVSAGGTLTEIASVSTSGYNFASAFTVTFEATGVYPTMLVATCKFGDGSTRSIQIQDSTALLQTSGYGGFAAWVSGTNNVESATIESRKPLPSAVEKIAFVGDSNYTTSYPTTADCIPTQCANRLTNITGSPYSAVILGSTGAQANTWVVGGALWNLQTPNITSNNCKKVVLMLGTNDAKANAGISTATFMSDLNNVVSGLLALSGVQVVTIMAPFFHGGNIATFNGRSIENLDAIIRALADRYPTKGSLGAVLADPGEAYYHIKRNYSTELSDGIHVNATGGQNVGTIQADCIARAIGL
jgi:lysophospholipase L1-like esterase